MKNWSLESCVLCPRGKFLNCSEPASKGKSHPTPKIAGFGCVAHQGVWQLADLHKAWKTRVQKIGNTPKGGHQPMLCNWPMVNLCWSQKPKPKATKSWFLGPSGKNSRGVWKRPSHWKPSSRMGVLPLNKSAKLKC